MTMKTFFKYVLTAGITISGLLCGLAFADSLTSGIAMSQLSQNVGNTVGYLAAILSDTTTVGGAGFVLASFFKFHQHKNNPTQVAISQPITLLAIGSAMLVFPYILTTGKKTVFGSAEVAKIGGTAVQAIIGKPTT